MYERDSSVAKSTQPALSVPISLFVESNDCRDVFFLEERVVVLGGEGAVAIEQTGLATALGAGEGEAPVFDNVVEVAVLDFLHVFVSG